MGRWWNIHEVNFNYKHPISVKMMLKNIILLYSLLFRCKGNHVKDTQEHKELGKLKLI